MKDRKAEYRYFTMTQHKKEERYLQKRHKEGWKFTRVTAPGIYHFEKCVPEDVVYQLDYNKDGLEHKSEYIQMFHDCEWEYMQDFMGYSYFRKPAAKMKGRETIFCDDASRQDMMKRVFRGRMIPLIIIFCGIIIPQMLLSGGDFGREINQIFFWAYLVLFLLYFMIFLEFAIQYWKLRKHSKNK